MSAAHTPGPWRLEAVEDRAIKHLCPVGADDLSVLTVVQHDGTPFAAVYSDNDARLMAAAPDLLAALKTCVAQLEMTSGLVHDERMALIDARAAIAKATGATP